MAAFLVFFNFFGFFVKSILNGKFWTSETKFLSGCRPQNPTILVNLTQMSTKITVIFE